MAAAHRARAEDSTRQAEAEATASRQRVVQLESHLKARIRELEKAQRAVSESGLDSDGQQARTEESLRALEAKLTGLRAHASQLQSALKARDKQVEKLGKAVEAARVGEAQLALRHQELEEASRTLAGHAGGLRQRLQALTSALRGREHACAQLNKALDAARAAEQAAYDQRSQAEEATRKLEGELALARQRAVQAEAACRSKERELISLQRSLQAVRRDEFEASAQVAATEEAAQKLDTELGSVRARLFALEGGLKARNAEVDKLSRQLSGAKGNEEEAAARQRAVEEAFRHVEGDLAGMRSRLLLLQGALKTKERELERCKQEAETARVAEASSDLRVAEAEVAAQAVREELAAAKQRAVQLEGMARSRQLAAEKASRAADEAKAAQRQLAVERAEAEGRCLALVSDLAAARQRLVQVEGSARSKDKEVMQLSKQVEAVQSAESNVATQKLAVEEAVRHLESELSGMRVRLQQQEAAAKTKDKEVERLLRQAEQAKAAEGDLVTRLSDAEEAARIAQTALATARQRIAQAEALTKTRDREVERLNRLVDAAKSEAAGQGVAAGKSATRLEEEVKKLEAALAQAQARVTSLESSLATADREAQALRKASDWRRDTEAESAVAATDRATKAEEGLRKAESELTALRTRAAQMEHALRAREAAMDKLRGALADKVAREERVVARDKQVYARLRSAFATHREQVLNGSTNGKGPGTNAAGAVAAAARELRPVEIVGLYEQQRETLDSELTAARKEVRLLAEQLRDAQNMISVKDRTGGWRNPGVDAEIQNKVLAMEQRAADLTRQLAVARTEGSDAVRAAELRCAEFERRAHALAEENSSLLAELQARPTLQDARSLKREVEILERRLSSLKHGSGGGGPDRAGGQLGGSSGVAAEGGELALGLAGVGRSALSTRDAIRRDREVHRLQLMAVEDLARQVLVDLVQDVCIELDVSDVTALTTHLRKLLRVVSAVPRMEAFIGEVCEAVYTKGSALLPQAMQGGPKDPTKVLPVLTSWVAALKDAAGMKALLASVAQLLGQRTEQAARAAGQPKTPEELMASLRQLVAAESHALAGAATMQAAEGALARADPHDVIAACVRHYQQLFECPKLEGVISSMNRVYMTLSEQRNFVRGLGSQLGLPQDTTTAACAAAVQGTLARAQAVISAAPPHATGAAPQPAQLQQQQRPPQHQQHEVAGREEWEETSRKLLVIFHVQSMQQVCEAAERMVARLRRFDEVLPRYQRMASQLYELLRVRVLEEVVPAVTALVAHASAA
ncbi:hypothetical protein V8C86DRAFT_73358 [Haematococcus lacustris]